MLVSTTPVKKKTYTIILASVDASSYESPTGSAWNASYFVNLNGIMSLEEQSRPYYVNFTFSSTSEADISGLVASGRLMLELDFGGRTFPHLTQYSQRLLPCGFISVKPPIFPAVENTCYLESLEGDNHPVYLHSLTGVSQIKVRFIELTAGLFTSTGNFILMISLEPASF